jgi:hypothetical protein
MITFAVMTLGTFVSDYSPVLNQYTTQITAVVGILFHISSTIIFESSEGHKFNIAKVSMIIGIVLPTFIILGVPAKAVGLFATIFYFFKK